MNKNKPYVPIFKYAKMPEPPTGDTIVQAVWDASQYVDDLIEQGIKDRKLIVAVRCRDCMCWDDYSEKDQSGYCGALGINMNPDDYCSYGKMKGTATHDAPKWKTENDDTIVLRTPARYGKTYLYKSVSRLVDAGFTEKQAMVIVDIFAALSGWVK